MTTTPTGPSVDDQLIMLAVVRGFVEYDDHAIAALFDTLDPRHLAVGLAAYAAVLVERLAEARGTTPADVLDRDVTDALTPRDSA